MLNGGFKIPTAVLQYCFVSECSHNEDSLYSTSRHMAALKNAETFVQIYSFFTPLKSNLKFRPCIEKLAVNSSVKNNISAI